MAVASERITAPPVELDRAAIDFGAIGEGAPASARLMVRNVSSRTIRVKRVATSCGCTTPDSPGAIPAGASRPLTVSYQSTGRKGPIDQEVVLEVEGYASRPLRVPVRGLVVAGAPP